MSILVTLEEMRAYLGLDEEETEDNGVIQSILDSVEHRLQEVTNRTFKEESQDIVDEVHDGFGTRVMYVNFPISVLDGVTIVNNYDDETRYDFDIDADFAYVPGSRRLYSRAFRFPRGKNNILVTYSTMPDIPEMAKLGVKELTAIIYRRRGSEEARSEQKGTFEHVLMRDVERESMFWSSAVALLMQPAIG